MTTKSFDDAGASDKGRYELTAPEFRSSVLGISSSSILVLDLDAIAPEFRGNANAGEELRQSYEDIWRSACDHVLMMNRGIYAAQDDGSIHVYFYELPAALGTLKMNQIADLIRDGLKAGGDEPHRHRRIFGHWSRNTLPLW